MSTLIEQLQPHNLPHLPDGSFIITDKQREAILSLLSQQAVVVESDEEAAISAYQPHPYPEMTYPASALLKIKQDCFRDGCTHVRQQLSKEQQQREEVMREIIQFTKDMLVFTRNYYREETVTHINQLLTKYNALPKTTHP